MRERLRGLAAGWTWVPRGRHLFVYDLLATLASVVGAFALRFDASNVLSWMAPYVPICFLPLLVLPPVYVAQGLYRRVWRYASMSEMFALVAAVAIGYGTCFMAFVVLSVWGIGGTLGFPRSVWFIEALLGLTFVGGARFLLRAALEQRGAPSGHVAETEPVPTIVYGAGEVGATVARVAARDRAAGLSVVGYLDDDPHKAGSRLMGKRVFGDLDALAEAVRATGARHLLLAMPEATGATVRRAFDTGQALGLEVRTVPRPRELLSGEVRLDSVRRVSVEDLLRRETVAIDLDAVAAYLSGASVLVTGGGGSIGSELCRQILALGPRQLVVLDHQEEALWTIERELGERSTGSPGMAFRTVLADIRSAPAMAALMAELRPDVVFHAAALKHVPIVEQHPAEGVLTNVLGTRNVLRACEQAEVARFVLISTDKAVDPVSAMGATKRIAEHLVVDTARRTGRPYVAVRFGNVLGSSGSVIPTFQHQLGRGGPLTVTHPDVTRYFMTIGEAVSLILEAASNASPGEIYVLDMGEPVRIVELARDLIRLSGLDPDQVPIVYTGLRAGERLHESLFYDHETTERTLHPGVLRVRWRGDGTPTAEGVADLVERLIGAAERREVRTVRSLLREAQQLAQAGQTAVGTG
ncbi:MAG TPA: nucleoside-diphosphate sugar epimerase/dehydratase [Candidatus Limnocylindrales bacterium]|nr:nucleoside-diphosphate sugar epimerase/dehydratase [Candidatus Limnocylindrales bacterium]